MAVVCFVERDPIFGHVHEEVAAVREAVIHFAERVDDEVDRRPQCLVDGKFADQAVVELEPVIDLVGQPLVVDDDQDIEVRAIAFGRVRFVDPAALGKIGDQRRIASQRSVSDRLFPNRTCAFRYASGSPEGMAKSGVPIQQYRNRQTGVHASMYCSSGPSRQSRRVGRR